MLKKLGLLSVAAVCAMAMHTGEININNEDIEVSLKFDMGQFNAQLDAESTYVGVRYISAENKYDTDGLFELSYLMKQPLEQMKDLNIGIGFKVDYSSVGAADYLAIPLGMEARYRLPIREISVPVYVGGQIYFAPSVLSFQEADNYFEFKANVDVEIIQRGLITLGYRHIKTDYEASNVIFNNAAFVGFKFVF